MNTANLKAPYGIIPMDIMRNRKLIQTQKLIYAILSAKQGTSEYARVSNQMLADAIGSTTRTVSSAIAELKNQKLIEVISRGEIQVETNTKQFGLVELDLLIASNLSANAKYLYLVYCAAGNDHDANYWGREMVCSKFQMSNSTYQAAHKELIDKGILRTIKQASAPNTQTVNINIISRAKNCDLTIPLSWVPEKAFDLEEWCETNIRKNGKLKQEVSVIESGSMGTLKQEESVQRIVTINSNLNSNLNTNDGLITNEDSDPPLALEATEEASEKTSLKNEESENAIDIDYIDKLWNTKLPTKEKAKKVLAQIKSNGGLSDYLEVYTTDLSMFDKVYNALEYLVEANEAYDIDTSSYLLNARDLAKFSEFVERIHGLNEERTRYHVERVVQLGIEREKREYISFSYVFSEHADLKQKIQPQKSIPKKLQPSVRTNTGDEFLYE